MALDHWSHPGLCWIIAPLCFIISSYLYFCQISTVERRSCGSDTTWRCLILLSSPGATHFSYITIPIRYSVDANCKLWFCCSVLLMWRLLQRPSVLGDGPPPHEASSISFAPLLISSLLIIASFPRLNRGSKDRSPYRLQSPMRRCDCDFGLYK